MSLGYLQNICFLVLMFVTAWGESLNWLGLSSTIFPNLTIFIHTLILPPRFFFQVFILDVMGRSEQFASYPKTSSCESHYLMFLPFPWGLRALIQQQSSGEGIDGMWVCPCSNVVVEQMLYNQVFTWVWSGRVIGIRSISLALPLAVITSKHQLFGALVSYSSLTLDT